MSLSGKTHTAFDLAIIGGGILGASTAYLLSSFSGLRILLVEKEMSAGLHSSTRNTGPIIASCSNIKS